MSTGAILTAIIGSAMALLLSWRALRSHRLDQRKTIQMALIWGAIIVGLTLLISQVKV